MTFRAGDAQVVIQWAPPLDNGGSTVTGYYVIVNDGQSNSWTDDRVAGTLEQQRVSLTSHPRSIFIGIKIIWNRFRIITSRDGEQTPSEVAT